jgi:hypothetical protein
LGALGVHGLDAVHEVLAILAFGWSSLLGNRGGGEEKGNESEDKFHGDS